MRINGASSFSHAMAASTHPSRNKQEEEERIMKALVQ